MPSVLVRHGVMSPMTAVLGWRPIGHSGERGMAGKVQVCHTVCKGETRQHSPCLDDEPPGED